MRPHANQQQTIFPRFFIIIIAVHLLLLLLSPLTASVGQQLPQHDDVDDDPFVERDEVIFPKQYNHQQQQQRQKHRAHRHHRWRRAPALWGEPAPDYSAVHLIGTPSTVFFLYALLFVDLKTSDHYRREHTVVKREVMRLANEANNYFSQIGVRLLIVDILETFRDDLSSLYAFEQYRNQRIGHLPFHNIAVLISHRYAGGLAFIGGMCTGRNVMMAGFYPHNPEAMAPIFFHEVAHLIGVPHRPINETFAISNCACPRGAHKATSEDEAFRSANSASRGANAADSFSSTTPAPGIVTSGTNLTTTATTPKGCLKIPGFDHDCSLQWMVNLVHQRNRCLAQQMRPNVTTLALCGNGVREGTEQCDCGPGPKCAEWNCEARTCALKWPAWAMQLAFAICVPLVLLLPALGWRLFYLQHTNRCGTSSRMNCLAMTGNNCSRPKHLVRREQLLQLMKPKRQKDLTFGVRNSQFWHKLKWKSSKKRKSASSSSPPAQICATSPTITHKKATGKGRRRHLLRAQKPFISIWRRLRTALGTEQRNGELIRQMQTRSAAGVAAVAVIRRPIRPPPPPPPPLFVRRPLPSPHRPKLPPPVAPQAKLLLQQTLRPTAPPPEPPPPPQKWSAADGAEEEEAEWSTEDEDDDEWGDGREDSAE